MPEQPMQRRAQVRVVALQAVGPLRLLRSGHTVAAALGERREVPGVSDRGRLRRWTGGQPGHRVHPDRFQQPVPLAAVRVGASHQQALLNQESKVGRPDRLRRPPPGRSPPESRRRRRRRGSRRDAGRGSQQRVAPVDGAPQRALPGWPVPRPSAGDVQMPVQVL